MGRRLAAVLIALPTLAVAQTGSSFWDSVIRPTEEDVAGHVAYFKADDLFQRGKGALLTGYVVGIIDADYASLGSRPYCVPDGVRGSQVQDVVWRFLEQNPKDRHLGAALIVRRSLTDAWPCVRR